MHSIRAADAHEPVTDKLLDQLSRDRLLELPYHEAHDPRPYAPPDA